MNNFFYIALYILFIFKAYICILSKNASICFNVKIARFLQTSSLSPATLPMPHS